MSSTIVSGRLTSSLMMSANSRTLGLTRLGEFDHICVPVLTGTGPEDLKP
jgi:hypothetical protein